MGFKKKKTLDILEKKVTQFLSHYAIDAYAREQMAPHIARISLMQNHLYEDLGFNNRIEMGKFMNEHFPRLSVLKPKEKLWKKFIYDSIGEIAPACKNCKDQISCFRCK